MKSLVVFGSRSLTSKRTHDFMKEKIKEIIEKQGIDFLITSGNIRGVSEHAKQIAYELKK